METPTKKNRFGAVGRLGGQVKRLGSGMKKQTMKTAGAVWSVGTGGSSGAGNGGDGHGFDWDDDERDERVMDLFRFLQL